ncbi:MAG: acyl carrier protein [Gammaproteobacteria bacterium]|nr:acyl carrier protein [Gammaproteobacteria bacterium]
MSRLEEAGPSDQPATSALCSSREWTDGNRHWPISGRESSKEASLDPDSRFFQVGGSSLDAMEMRSQVEQVFGTYRYRSTAFSMTRHSPSLPARLPPPAIATAASDEAPACAGCGTKFA